MIYLIMYAASCAIAYIIMVLYSCYDLHKKYVEYKKEAYLCIEKGHPLPTNPEIIENVLGNLLETTVLATVWPIRLLITTVEFLIKIKEEYESNNNVLLRYLKNYPELVQTILENPDHKYHSVAKELSESGIIILDKSTKMVEIDGKKYSIKIK